MVLTRRALGVTAGVAALTTGVSGLMDSAWAETAASGPHKPKLSSVEHLLRRTTYGATPALIAEVERKGIHAWLNEQLDPSHVKDSAMDHLLTRWPSQKLNTWQVRKKYSFGAWDVMADLIDTHIARAIWSKRQLLEVMVDFWSNHLNVTCPSDDVWDNRHVFDREVIRKHAFGRFSDMLRATGRAPAMLQYLGNAESSGDAPNENWGRELLELHTVGLAAKYSQKDVHNSALILSGLSVDDQGGEFEYKPWMHYVGHVKVMGFHSANSSATKGESVAMAYLTYLAHHPDTAKHIATKLAVRFVSDHPPHSLITKLAATYRRHGTAIRPVLHELFTSKEFWHSVDAKVRTPYEDFIATLRVLRIGPPKKGTSDVRALQYMAGSVGQPPLGWYEPNGYPDVAAAWSSTSSTLAKWNTHMGLAGQWYPSGLHYTKLTHLIPSPPPKTYGGLVDGLAASMSVPKLNAVQRGAIAEFLDHKAGDVLNLGDAAYGWRLPYVVALILDSSHQAQR